MHTNTRKLILKMQEILSRINIHAEWQLTWINIHRDGILSISNKSAQQTIRVLWQQFSRHTVDLENFL